MAGTNAATPYYDPKKNNGILRIGFDVDGVMSHFSPDYQRVITELTGKNLFEPGDADNPPCWDWDLLRGYTKAERARAFEHIGRHRTFWYDCPPLPGLWDLDQLRFLYSDHEVYFITNRGGYRVKYQTEQWFRRWLHIGPEVPITVVVNGHRSKGLVAKALNLDAYLDDNVDNVMDCLITAPECKTVLYNASYNQPELFPPAEEWLEKNLKLVSDGNVETVKTLLERVDRSRVTSVGEFLRAINAIRD